MWDARSNKNVADVFAKLWDSQAEEMLTSFDGVSIHMPPEQTGNGFFTGDKDIWFHTDQSYFDNSAKCVQGMVTLWDVEEGDATLACWPKSHALHEQFGSHFGLEDRKVNKNKFDYQKMGNDPKKWAWLEENGLQPACVKAKAGSLILWDSRTMHQGI